MEGAAARGQGKKYSPEIERFVGRLLGDGRNRGARMYIVGTSRLEYLSNGVALYVWTLLTQPMAIHSTANGLNLVLSTESSKGST